VGLDCDPFIHTSCVAGVIDVSHCIIICWDGVSRTSFASDPLISASWGARIIDMSYCSTQHS
jgi:hypothetical protein